MRPLLNLCMIVKDEESNIKSVLETVKPFVDSYTILDTGSTDDTVEIARKTMADLPGGVYEETFPEPFDFSAARNKSLDLGAKADNPAEFQLILSADEYLRDGQVLREYLETQRNGAVDLFRMRILIEETRFGSPRIFRTGSAWKYEGRIQEFPANHVDSSATTGVIPLASIEHVVSDPEKRFASIWETHIPLLKEALEENPEDARALTCLAAAYEALLPMMKPGERITYAMEAMSLYLRRLSLPAVSDAERDYFKFRYLTDARLTGVYSDNEIFVRAKELAESDPKRPETALLLVHAAGRVLPLPVVYQLAARAAQVASEADNLDSESVVSTTCGFHSHYIAAGLAKQIAAKKPNTDSGNGTTYENLARLHVSAGLAAGGSWEVFKTLATETKPSDETAFKPPKETSTT